MINPIEVINEGTREVNTKAGEFKIPKKIIITDTLKRILLLPLKSLSKEFEIKFT